MLSLLRVFCKDREGKVSVMHIDDGIFKEGFLLWSGKQYSEACRPMVCSREDDF